MSSPIRQLKCPICDQLMALKRSAGLEVDQCRRCKGLWLDAGEFDALIGERYAGKEMEAALAQTARPPAFCRSCGMGAGAASLQPDQHCSRCDGIVTAQCPVDGIAMDVVLLEDLEFDFCPVCRGLWIDGDERQGVAAASARQRDSQDDGKDARAGNDTGQGRQGNQHSPTGESSTRQEDSATIVVCAGCLDQVLKRQTVFRDGDIWCETCVVSGKVPTIQGRTVSELHAQATMNFARAKADQRERRAGVDSVKNASRTPPLLARRGGSPRSRALLTNVARSAVRKVKRLFGKKEPWE